MAESIVEKVTMTDGSIKEFTGKKRLIKSVAVGSAGATINLFFRNGEVREFVLPTSLMYHFAGHGASQKLGDAVAGETDIDSMVQTIDELMARLNKGEWVERREGGTAGASVLARALMEYSGKTKEQVTEYLSTKTQAQKVALRNSEKLRPIVQRIEAEKAEKAGGAVDASALLDELGD